MVSATQSNHLQKTLACGFVVMERRDPACTCNRVHIKPACNWASVAQAHPSYPTDADTLTPIALNSVQNQGEMRKVQPHLRVGFRRPGAADVGCTVVQYHIHLAAAGVLLDGSTAFLQS